MAYWQRLWNELIAEGEEPCMHTCDTQAAGGQRLKEWKIPKVVRLVVVYEEFSEQEYFFFS